MVNPYEPSSTVERSSPQWWPVFLAIMGAWVATVAVLWRLLGVHGFGLGLLLAACSCFFISRQASPIFWPLNRERMTGVEMIVVVAICLLLYGLMLPAVETRCRQPSIPSSAAGR